ncbi:MAG TPA: hypothetical protein VM076_19430 [Gemmatimonadaceae bacterium]|nr:hypothetical protein [Gemmatimonadaceae bacterium]
MTPHLETIAIALPLACVAFAPRPVTGQTTSAKGMTTEDLERQNTTRVSTALAKLPGLVLVRANAAGDLYVGSTRGAQSIMRGNGGKPCPADVVLDGIFVGTRTDVDKLLQKSDIAAVEWYASTAQMPVKYGGTTRGCAVLVIWTH